jgi:hypothetical protein
MAQENSERMSDALKIMGEVPLIGQSDQRIELNCSLVSDNEEDGHNDWPHLIRGHYDNRLDARFSPENDLAGHVDIKRLREGKIGGVFWSAYVDW